MCQLVSVCQFAAPLARGKSQKIEREKSYDLAGVGGAFIPAWLLPENGGLRLLLTSFAVRFAP